MNHSKKNKTAREAKKNFKNGVSQMWTVSIGHVENWDTVTVQCVSKQYKTVQEQDKIGWHEGCYKGLESYTT